VIYLKTSDFEVSLSPYIQELDQAPAINTAGVPVPRAKPKQDLLDVVLSGRRIEEIDGELFDPAGSDS